MMEGGGLTKIQDYPPLLSPPPPAPPILHQYWPLRSNIVSDPTGVYKIKCEHKTLKMFIHPCLVTDYQAPNVP